MNVINDLKIKDMLFLEEKINNSLKMEYSFRELADEICTECNEALTDDTKNMIMPILKEHSDDIVDWNSEAIHKLYYKVLEEVASGKLHLSNNSFLEKYIGRLNCVFNREIINVEDIRQIRNDLRNYLRLRNYSDKFIFDFIIATTEAASNALVHYGRGSYLFLTRDGFLYSYIFDRGTGIPMNNLASLIFGSNQSDNEAKGYEIILNKADNVYLKYFNGVKILLEFDCKQCNRKI